MGNNFRRRWHHIGTELDFELYQKGKHLFLYVESNGTKTLVNTAKNIQLFRSRKSGFFAYKQIQKRHATRHIPEFRSTPRNTGVGRSFAHNTYCRIR